MSETKDIEGSLEPQADLDADKPTEAETASPDAEPSSAEPETTALAAPVKKKRRAKSAETGPEEIRDRNQRVRAEAADKRRSRREREARPQTRDLDAGEMMDDALSRSAQAASGFLRRNASILQWVVLGGLAAWIGWAVYSWRSERSSEQGTAILFKALGFDNARIADAPSEADPRTGLVDTRPTFASEAERVKKAEGEYRLASSQISASGPAALAQLGLAGALYDAGKFAEAVAEYEKVKASKLAERDSDVRARVIEGIGMSLEAKNDLDGALKAFRELENTGISGFPALGLYHQARISKAQGKTEDAKNALKKAGEKLVAAKDTLLPSSYVRHAVLELYQSLDPAAAKALTEKLTPAMPGLEELAGGAGGGGKFSQEKLQELIRQMQNKSPAPAPSGAK